MPLLQARDMLGLYVMQNPALVMLVLQAPANEADKCVRVHVRKMLVIFLPPKPQGF